MTIPQQIANQQTVGNIGLFYVCYRLSRLGWNVMPTARNAKGIDILIYSQDASQTLTIQVKTLSKGSPVPLSNKLDHLFADFVVVCRHVIREIPECFVLTPAEIRRLAHRGEKDGKVSFWLQPRDYGTDEFREKWERIGTGLSAEIMLASLFREEPEQWGLRGDPYLWAEMRRRFKRVACPTTPEGLVALVEGAFAELTGHPISYPESICLEKYSHGGMSSGHVCPEFWREVALPLLRGRLPGSGGTTDHQIAQ